MWKASVALFADGFSAPVVLHAGENCSDLLGAACVKRRSSTFPLLCVKTWLFLCDATMQSEFPIAVAICCAGSRRRVAVLMRFDLISKLCMCYNPRG